MSLMKVLPSSLMTGKSLLNVLNVLMSINESYLTFSEVPDLRQSFLILKNVFEMYLRNEFQEAIDLTDKYANQEMIHCGTKALLIGLGMILSWDVVKTPFCTLPSVKLFIY